MEVTGEVARQVNARYAV